MYNVTDLSRGLVGRRIVHTGMHTCREAVVITFRGGAVGNILDSLAVSLYTRTSTYLVP
jgi:hypothetical protein